MNRTLTLCVVSLFLCLAPQQKANAGNWDSWRFLLGKWAGKASGQPGEGTGTFTFRFELQGKILVRRNRDDFPATKDHPASSHEDLMVVYPETGGPRTRAIYFDSEGHVIQYTAEFSEDQKTLIFLSDPVPSAPRFRLTYTRGENGSLAIKFAIAPPGKPDAFSTHVEGVAHRQQAP
jgi:hypothetical protein